jgi:hypothetical protein
MMYEVKPALAAEWKVMATANKANTFLKFNDTGVLLGFNDVVKKSICRRLWWELTSAVRIETGTTAKGEQCAIAGTDCRKCGQIAGKSTAVCLDFVGSRGQFKKDEVNLQHAAPGYVANSCG